MSSNENRTGMSWGAIIVIVVVAMIAGSILDGPRSDASERRIDSPDSTFDDTAFLGGIRRENGSSTFRGGRATAFMGGINLDFRDANMEGDEARIDISAVMGGVDIRVPRTWTVVNRIVPVMGGVTDRTVAPSESAKRLILDGAVLMGGVKIRN